jgi:4-hydroxybenzoate polyprenyltransferase
MYFFKLIRPINLLIIGLTMYSVRFFYFTLGGMEANVFTGGEKVDYALLVFSTLLIAAAGNIINDYFDVRADRINKPNKLIITKHIKRRWAIVYHWILNLAAFSIAIYLSMKYNTLWYVFVHVVSINSLYFYSMYFKRKPLIGNIIIAALTALVPILCGIHFYLNARFITDPYKEVLPIVNSLSEAIDVWKLRLLKHGGFIYVWAAFAFILNLAREIIKDIQDVEGDKLLYAKTLPISRGVVFSTRVASLILLIAPVTFLVLFFMPIESNYPQHMLAMLPFLLSILFNFISIFLLFNKNTSQSKLKQADLFVKLSMLMGILIPYYWWLVQ